jgi:hypothetical protein
MRFPDVHHFQQFAFLVLSHDFANGVFMDVSHVRLSQSSLDLNFRHRIKGIVALLIASVNLDSSWTAPVGFIRLCVRRTALKTAAFTSQEISSWTSIVF